MDNHYVHIVGNGEVDFRKAIEIAMTFNPKAVAYSYEEDGHVLVLYWVMKDSGTVALPYEMNVEQSIDFLLGWLENAPRGPRPDMDGSVGDGWKVFVGDRGHALPGVWQATVAVSHEWALYGK